MDTLRIAVIDDSIDARAGLQSLLEAHHHHVHGFESATQFLNDGDPRSYDAILLDYCMPGMNGLELLRHLVESDIDTPVIMISSEGDVELGHSSAELGSVQWVPKPLRSTPIIAALEKSQRILAERRAARSREPDVSARELARLDLITNAEWRVLKLLVREENPTSKEIARELGISDRTVQSHRDSIAEKLGSRSPVFMYRLLAAAGKL